MFSQEILFFMLCPIAMAALWGALYYLLKDGFQSNESSIMNFIFGLIVTIVTTIYVLINISNAKSEYSYHNIKLDQIVHLKLIYVQYDHLKLQISYSHLFPFVEDSFLKLSS